MEGRFVRFGFKGCPDVLGQLRDGRLLGVAVKAKVKSKAEELVRKSEVRNAVRKGQAVTETMQVAAAATLQADIIIGHRQDITAARWCATSRTCPSLRSVRHKLD